MTTGEAYYAKQSNSYLIKLVGDVRYTLSCALDDFLNQLFARNDYDDILIDLSEADSIDSTSLGLLAKIANFMRERFGKKATLISANPDINQMLDSVGFSDIFLMRQDLPADSTAGLKLAITEPSKEELTKTLYEAHHTLVELNDNNRRTFHDLVETLRGRLVSQSSK
ncbi:MAG: STAS domain-containing protein [Gammaproteobacteria bacterium]|nr:STAS domain-containing protein [Gammaproteobacteria bacterium]